MTNILLVEDDKTLAMGIEYSLNNEGFCVTVANSLEEAKSKFINEIDLILLDITLPDGTGYDFCKIIRNKSQVPIIFLTACDDEVNTVLGLDLGADDYITKPFRLKELISRIRAVLRRSYRNNKSEVVESNNIKVNSSEALVYKFDKQIMLTPSEYKLLLIFMKNKNQVLSRQQILKKIWDCEGDFVDDNTLSVYIKRLREKIEEDPSNPKNIITIRGLGYKWNDGVNI